MRLVLQNLLAMHPKLVGQHIDYHRAGALAMQRASHRPPALANVQDDSGEGDAEIDWLPLKQDGLGSADQNRVTEDGAEAVALCYVSEKAGWVVKRRLQQGESADWLLEREGLALALEVSGVAEGGLAERLVTKRKQVGRCSLPAERLAVVVEFARPMVAAGGAL